MMKFGSRKQRALTNYKEALDNGLVDANVIQINALINKMYDYYTTSSCYGRLIVISKSGSRSKYSTTFHIKEHNPDYFLNLNISDLEFSDQLWLLLESPNFHIICRNKEAANKLHKSAFKSKLGLSKIQSLDPSIVVEILGTAKMQLPLGEKNKLLVSDLYLDFLLKECQYLLRKDQDRLDTWRKTLEEFMEKK